MIYTTKSGDMWDLIAYQQLGDCRYTQNLVNANREYIDTFIFRAGVELELPKIEKATTKGLPPWKR